MTMPIYKEQRYRHSEEIKKDAIQRGGIVDVHDFGEKGTWYDFEDGSSIHVPYGEVGPATNMAVVALFSVAGVIILLFLCYGGYLPFLWS
jgi:hypothetical protein